MTDRDEPSPEVMSFHSDIIKRIETTFAARYGWNVLDYNGTLTFSSFFYIDCTRTSFIISVLSRQQYSVLTQNNKMPAICWWTKPIVWAFNSFLM